ncbi:MAG: hypothetical protein AAFQ83_09005 [Bacteroidota bacterium]
MKKTITTIIFLLSLSLSAWSQEVQTATISPTFDDIPFSSMEVEGKLFHEGNIYLELNLQRKGAIQQNLGKVKTGGKDEKTIPAKAFVKLDNNLQVEVQDFFFYKTLLQGKVTYLKAPIKKGQMDVLAPAESIVPEEKLESKSENFFPAVSKNSITRSAGNDYEVSHLQPKVGLTLKGVKGLKIKYMEPSQYGFIKKDEKEYPLSNQDLGLNESESFFFGSYGQQTAVDKISGYSYGLFGINVKKDKTDIQFRRHLIYVISQEGKVKTHELESEKPLVASGTELIYAPLNQNPRPVEKVIFFQREVKRKSNPNPNKRNQRILVLDAKGELERNYFFERKENYFKYALTENLPNGDIFFMASGSNPSGIAYYVFGENGLKKGEIIESDHPLMKKMKFPRALIGDFRLFVYQKDLLPDGSMLLSTRVKSHAVVAGVAVKDYGKMFLKIGSDGSIVDGIFLSKEKAEGSQVEVSEYILARNEKEDIYLEESEIRMRFGEGESAPVLTASVGRLIHVNKETLEVKITKLYGGENRYFKILKIDKENRQLYTLFEHPLKMDPIHIGKYHY